MARDGAQPVVVIWNPDGSTAEMSGNGMRIAARGCWARTGAREVAIETDGRRDVRPRASARRRSPRTSARSPSVTTRSSRRGRATHVVPVAVGNPHAVVRRRHADPRRPPAARPAAREHPRIPRSDERPARRADGPSDVVPCSSGSGRGGDEGVGLVGLAVAAAAAAHGWCVEPRTVHMPGGDLFVTVSGRQATLGPAERICVGRRLCSARRRSRTRAGPRSG